MCESDCADNETFPTKSNMWIPAQIYACAVTRYEITVCFVLLNNVYVLFYKVR